MHTQNMLFLQSSKLRASGLLSKERLQRIQSALLNRLLKGEKHLSESSLREIVSPIGLPFGDTILVLVEAEILSQHDFYHHRDSGEWLDTDEFRKLDDLTAKEYEYYARYEIIGTPAPLIQGLSELNASVFISFSTRDSLDLARRIFTVLQTQGIDCFLSSESIRSGNEGTARIWEFLKTAQVVIILEGHYFQKSDFCVAERLFAVAAGKILLRFTLSDIPGLEGLREIGAPEELDTIQSLSIGGFIDDAASKILNENPTLCGKTSLEVRRLAAARLAEKLSQVEVDAIAMRLNLSDDLAGSVAERKIKLLFEAFRTETKAQRFCRELPQSVLEP